MRPAVAQAPKGLVQCPAKTPAKVCQVLASTGLADLSALLIASGMDKAPWSGSRWDGISSLRWLQYLMTIFG